MKGHLLPHISYLSHVPAFHQELLDKSAAAGQYKGA